MRHVVPALVLATLASAAQSQAQDTSPNPNAPSLPGRSPGDEDLPTQEDEDGAEPSAPPEEQRLQLLEQELAELRERLQATEDRETTRTSPLSINGYVDLGFFVPLGNDGVGWVRDVGNQQLPVAERLRADAADGLAEPARLIVGRDDDAHRCHGGGSLARRRARPLPGGAGRAAHVAPHSTYPSPRRRSVRSRC